MMAVGSFKKVAGTALAACGEHDQSSAESNQPAARIVSPVPNASIWIGNDWYDLIFGKFDRS
jgi:hypothetical protein